MTLAALLVAACGDVALDQRAPLPASAPRSPSSTSTAWPTAAPTPSCTTQSMLAGWTNQRLAWQVIVVPVQLTSLHSAGAAVAAGAGGILLFGATAPADLAAELKRLESTSPGGIAPLAMSDIEGGDVERATNLVGPMPSARRLAQTMSPAGIRAFATAVGRRMRAIGIAMDLAPVMDLDAGYGPTAGNPDGTRSFSADPQVAAQDASAFAAGLAAAGVVAAAKHFPGLHGAGDDTDSGPAQTSSWDALQQTGLVPFRAALKGGVPAVMLSNASIPGLTPLPASISPQAVAVLRERLAFNGLILTDSLTAGALARIGLSVPQAATAALVAGADMITYNGAAAAAWPNARNTASAIEAALSTGRLPRAQLIASVSRVLAAKGIDLCSIAPTPAAA